MVVDCSSSIILLISVVEFCVLTASVLTSSATTAKPRPCSPARAASIAAFNERRLVWSAMLLMTSSTDVIPLLFSCKKFTRSPAVISSSDN